MPLSSIVAHLPPLDLWAIEMEIGKDPCLVLYIHAKV